MAGVAADVTCSLKSPEEQLLYSKATERFINNTNAQMKKYTLFNIVLLIPSVIFLCLIVSSFIGDTELAFDDIIKLLGAGGLFSSITFFALNQLQKCWCCKHSCNIAIYHLDLHDPTKAFHFMSKSECLRQGANAAKVDISH